MSVIVVAVVFAMVVGQVVDDRAFVAGRVGCVLIRAHQRILACCCQMTSTARTRHRVSRLASLAQRELSVTWGMDRLGC